MRHAFVLTVALVVFSLACSGASAQSAPESSSAPDAPLATTAPAQAPTVSLGQPVELAPGEAVIVADTGTLVTFHGVDEDSRCPAQVTCIWAGRVTIAVEVLAPGSDTDAFTLATCCTDDARQHAYAGQTFALIDVTPAPGAPGQPIADQDYRAQLTVL